MPDVLLWRNTHQTILKFFDPAVPDFHCKKSQTAGSGSESFSYHTGFHLYIHSFRAAQGTKRHEKNVGLLQLSFYNCSIGIFSILQITGRWVGCPFIGWPYFYMCRMLFQAQISVPWARNLIFVKTTLVFILSIQSMLSTPYNLLNLWFWKESLWL